MKPANLQPPHEEDRTMSRSDPRRSAAAASARKSTDRRRIIIFATIGVVALLIVAAFVVGSRTPEVASVAPTLAQIKIGQDAPPFSVATTLGPRSVPSADKKPVLLEVFATWCPHCQRETTVLNGLFDRYGSKVDFVAVSGSPYAIDETSPESQADVVAFTERFKTRYPVAYDADLKVMKAYLQGGYPTMVLIGRDDKILWIKDGEITADALSKQMDLALKA
jgi:thiol-disulfide isomerase/thioredoxin